MDRARQWFGFGAVGGSVEIRRYRESDEEAVARLWREVFPDAPSWNHPETDIARTLRTADEVLTEL